MWKWNVWRLTRRMNDKCQWYLPFKSLFDLHDRRKDGRTDMTSCRYATTHIKSCPQQRVTRTLTYDGLAFVQISIRCDDWVLAGLERQVAAVKFLHRIFAEPRLFRSPSRRLRVLFLLVIRVNRARGAIFRVTRHYDFICILVCILVFCFLFRFGIC